MPAKYTPKQQIDAFWAKVKLPDQIGTDECWEWQASHNSRGYGNFKFGYKNCRTNRVSFELVNGPFDDDLHVLHSCDNPSCVNPDHLFLGTPLINTQDRERKGRGNHVRGEAVGNSKIKKTDVLYIKKLSNDGLSQRAIAKIIGISQRHVSRILRGEVWRHLK